MLLPDEQEFLEYVTENYSERKRPAKKEWTFQEYFNFVPEDLEDMLIDLFTRYDIEHSNFDLDNYFEPELFWWQWKLRKQWRGRKLKPLTLEMIIESAKAGRWLYD
ncbi:DUF1493 family protein [Atlantibacter hermannii]|uniref:DUF1493 family protein n=1 Tax=Atlantibacter hermannii TaxID=565 RepID=UPI001933F407|nr:DUF1493 family protein [Atlantibacter hermannii]MBL7636695.1 DUF1493 family protein [Atlantibacter hermannii]MBL7675585.1 DUF1493 family protein [Atlantibacter hermannii]MCZ7834905.1 DUF1493 family protein [Atlantibacter hermannii]